MHTVFALETILLMYFSLNPHPNLPPRRGKEPIPSPLRGRARVGVEALVTHQDKLRECFNG